MVICETVDFTEPVFKLYKIREHYLIVPKGSITEAIDLFVSRYPSTKGYVYVAIETDNGYNLYNIKDLTCRRNGLKKFNTLAECKKYVENMHINYIGTLVPNYIREFDDRLKRWKERGDEYAMVCYNCLCAISGQVEHEQDVARLNDPDNPLPYSPYLCQYCEEKLSKKYFKKKEE